MGSAVVGAVGGWAGGKIPSSLPVAVVSHLLLWLRVAVYVWFTPYSIF